MPHKSKRSRSRDPYKSRMYKNFASKSAVKKISEELGAIGEELGAYREKIDININEIGSRLSKIEKSSEGEKSFSEIFLEFLGESAKGAGSELGKLTMQSLFEYARSRKKSPMPEYKLGPGAAVGLSAHGHDTSVKEVKPLTITPETAAQGVIAASRDAEALKSAVDKVLAQTSSSTRPETLLKNADAGVRQPAHAAVRTPIVRDYTYRATRDRIREYGEMSCDELVSRMFVGLRGERSYVSESYKLFADFFEHPKYFSSFATTPFPREGEEDALEYYTKSWVANEDNKERVREEMQWMDKNIFYCEDLPKPLTFLNKFIRRVISNKFARGAAKHLANERAYREKPVVFDETPDGTIKIAKALAKLHGIKTGDPVYVEFTGFGKDYAKSIGLSGDNPRFDGHALVVEDNEGRISVECRGERIVDESHIEEYTLIENRGDGISLNSAYGDKLLVTDRMEPSGSNGCWLEYHLEKISPS